MLRRQCAGSGMDEHRPLLRLVRAGDRLVNLTVALLIVLLLLYSAYSIWYTQSLTRGSFLSDELAMYKPTGTSPTLADLMELNRDVRSWLTIDGTHIDYPVVQGSNDFEYLNKDVQGRFSLAGAIFLCSANSPDFSDPYNVVYGHHVEGGAMFSDVLEFRSAEFFEAHPSGTLWLNDGAFRIEVFACMEANAYDSKVYQPPESVEGEKFMELVEYIYASAAQSRTVEINENDSIIALSTCETAQGFDRVLLFGKLIKMSEEEMRAGEEDNLREQEEAAAAAEQEQEQGFTLPTWALPAGIGLFIIIVLAVFLITRRRSY